MRVLVACEYSGVTRRAFAALGHEAWSCDLLESEDNSPYHHIGDVTPLLTDHWDLMVCHPPCQHLSRSGATYWADKVADGRQSAALTFVCTLMAAPIPKIALENPVGIISTIIGRPSQYIQPWQFGHGETKKNRFMAQGFAGAPAHQRGAGPGESRCQNARAQKPLDGPLALLSRHRRSNGRTVG